MNTTRNIKHLLAAACLAVILPAMLFAQQAPPSSTLDKTTADETAALVSVLTSEADVFDKAMACRRLSVVGDESAVPALIGLLADEKLAGYARSALQEISGPRVDAALRESLVRLDGERLIGVLGSIGTRRDAMAVEPVAKLLTNDDPAVAATAARTLGYIGTLRAANLLQKTLTDASPELRPAVGNACLICAQALAKQGRTDEAAALCDVIEKADLPKHVRLAATFNAILAQGKDGLPRLAEQLESDDEARFRLALRAVRRLDVDTSAVLVAQFKTQPPARRALLLVALGDGDPGNRAVLPMVVEAARTGDIEVRVEAIRALARLGDATVVPVLLDAAAQPDERLAAAARSTLAHLDSDEINTAIVDLLASDDARIRQMAIDVTAQRKIDSAVPTLLKLANGTDATVRSSAIEALGSTARLEDLDDFIALAIGVQNSADSADFPTVRSALKSACMRMPQEACAEKLASAMPNASAATKIFLLEQLASAGGTTALKTVVAAAKSNDDTMRDTATRLLGEWLTADVAPPLFDLAKTLPEGKYKVRALRGYVRVARQLDMTPDERMTVCRNTLAIAARVNDKKLVFEVFRRHPTPEGLSLAASLLDDKGLQALACSTIVSMADGIAAKAPEQTEKALLQVLELTNDPALKADAEKSLLIARERIQPAGGCG